jgi:cytochrome P450
MLDYLRELIAEHHVRPTGDVWSALVRKADTSGQITEDEPLALGENLVANGYETMANEIASFVHVVLTHDDQLTWLRAHLSCLQEAIEELLRFVPLAVGAPGASGHARIATADIQVDGLTVVAGDAILPALNSANRDERVFSHPDRLDLDRAHAAHVTFEHGPHDCLGAHLARMELQVILPDCCSASPSYDLSCTLTTCHGRQAISSVVRRSGWCRGSRVT